MARLGECHAVGTVHGDSMDVEPIPPETANPSVAAHERRTSPRTSAICLSGGGYRAMLFHVGALRRLHELDLLRSTDRVSSVSGGSIVAALLALTWDANDGPDVEAVEKRVFDLAGRTLDWPSVFGAPVRGKSPAMNLARHYDKHLFDGRSLQDIIDVPRFVFNTTNMRTGSLMRWSRPYGADYAIGQIRDPDIALSLVVAASSAFPPFLSPIRISPPGPFVDFDTQQDVGHAGPLWLTDGGVYDNFGLQTAESFETVLISDGGAPFSTDTRMRTNWMSQTLRTISLLTDQVRRRRQFEQIQTVQHENRTRVFWTIGDAPTADGAPFTQAAAKRLALTPTRLRKMSIAIRYELMNLGYVTADQGLRVGLDIETAPTTRLPYPARLD